MKIKLKNDLFDTSIISLVGYDENSVDEEGKPLPKIYFLHAPDSTPGAYIEYEIYDEKEAFHDENTALAIDYYIQVDIFTPSDYTLIETAVKTVLKEKGYDGGHGPDLYEKDTKLYHKPLRFTYTEILE